MAPDEPPRRQEGPSLPPAPAEDPRKTEDARPALQAEATAHRAGPPAAPAEPSTDDGTEASLWFG